MEYMVIYKTSWDKYVLRCHKQYTLYEARKLAKEINGLVIHHSFADCLDLM